MSETKKFTQEEIDRIKDLRDANNAKISEFGQIEVEVLITSQRLESLSEAKNNTIKEYEELQESERNLVKELNEKYGDGTIDIQSGEFTPTN